MWRTVSLDETGEALSVETPIRVFLFLGDFSLATSMSLWFPGRTPGESVTVSVSDLCRRPFVYGGVKFEVRTYCFRPVFLNEK